MAQSRLILRTLGSLTLAAALLVLLAVAMGWATVYEVTWGPEGALAVFYQSWWFAGLLALLGANVLASLLIRWPISRVKIGFALTHGAVLLILVGAWVTWAWGIDGRLALAEGQKTRSFRIERDILALQDAKGDVAVRLEFPPAVSRSVEPADKPVATPLSFADLQVSVDRYIPDTRAVDRMRDGVPEDPPAVEVSLTRGERDLSGWVLAGQSPENSNLPVTFRRVADADTWQRLTGDQSTSAPASSGVVRLEVQGQRFEWPVETCLHESVQAGETGYTLRVLRYLPHATVGADRQITNLSNEPINPAIEVELVGPEGTVRRLAFARFPDFQAMHGQTPAEMKLTFVASPSARPTSAVEILLGPDDALAVRLLGMDGKVTSHKLTVGQTLDTPWPGIRLTVTRFLAHARRERIVEPVEPARDVRIPALLVTVRQGGERRTLWVRKHQPFPVSTEQGDYALVYREQDLPLGFELTLNDFKIGRYPGTMQPRTFESHITITDPVDGRQQGQVVSMNHPVRHGRYRLFQSSYQENPEDGSAVSILSVAWDPGQPIVFSGYVLLMVGFAWVLVTRRRRSQSGRGNGS